ncbi:epoxyqueuosine reductase [Oscillospiraceae bacterium CM]|nr:epoxyqueuosine reductase [Oscillospiraceae bacterium CM]
MNQELTKLLTDHGASLIGFADIDGLYQNADVLALPRSVDSETAPFDIPRFPKGISIAVALPRDVIGDIRSAPTMDYFQQYHALNKKLDMLAVLCAEALNKAGYQAYPQTVSATKEYGVFRTIMPHKTVAVRAGLGWIGKSALFVTEQYGSAVRLTSVLTNAPLQCAGAAMTPKCGDCMICTNACPGKAILGRLWHAEMDRDTYFDAMACRLKAREIAAKALNKDITLCGKCIEICSYTQGYISRNL